MSNLINEHMNIVIVGHVDHGKSTVIGRLLADTHSLPEGKLEAVKEKCRRNAKPFEYAFLLDALKDEQEQGITIDAARCFFKSDLREYIIIDAPGHIEFLRNMVTGASRAEAALLVIDADEGIKENSKRHGYLLSMLGIKKIAVLVNKMDLVDYDQEVFNNIVDEYSTFLDSIDVKPLSFLPISAFYGDNIVANSENTPWYKGHSVLNLLDSLENEQSTDHLPLRLPVQGVYKFTKGGDNRRIIAGTIESGQIQVGDEVVFYPSGKKTKVKTIESFATEEKKSASTGDATGFTLEEQIYVKRGELAVLAKETQAPTSSSEFRANVFWLGKNPLEYGKQYTFKIGSANVKGQIKSIERVLDASNLSASQKNQVDKHDVAEIIISTTEAVSFDLAHELPKTSRFVIVDDYEISGGGIILRDESVNAFEVQHKISKNQHWHKSLINKQHRIERYSQQPALVVISGEADSGKKPLAKHLEKSLFDSGRLAYFMSVGNIKYGLDDGAQTSQILRLSEVANVLLDAGTIAISTATDLKEEDYRLIDSVIEEHKVIKVWIGDLVSDRDVDIIIQPDDVEKSVSIIKDFLKEEGIIYKGA